MGIGLNYCQYGVLYLGSHDNTGPDIHFPHFGNSNLGKLPNLKVQGLSFGVSGLRFRVSAVSLHVPTRSWRGLFETYQSFAPKSPQRFPSFETWRFP